MSKHRAPEDTPTIPQALMDIFCQLETVPMFVVRHDHVGPCDPLCPAWDMEAE